MPSVISPQWQEKASGFFQSSGVKLKEAGQSAGSFVGEVAKDAKGNVGEVAEKVGSVVKSRWSLLQQPSTRHAMQERFISAAATTSFFLRKGFLETKDKVAVGKTKVEEVAKKTAQKSKTLLTDIERWQKGVVSTDVFGVPINILVQRQQSTRSVPYIMVKCADYLVLSGLNSPELFKAEGDKKVIHQLVSLYNHDQNASIPEGVNPVDIAALMKCYLASLPEPLTTFELYNEIRGARSSIHTMKNTLKKIPTVNYMTLELITALLLRVSQKSLVNKLLFTEPPPKDEEIAWWRVVKLDTIFNTWVLNLVIEMDARTLATEMAPILIWQRGQGPHQFDQFWNHSARTSSKKYMDSNYNSSAWEMLEDEDENVDASSPIPLDDGLPIDLGAIDAIQCLIEHHNAIFTDANETVWR